MNHLPLNGLLFSHLKQVYGTSVATLPCAFLSLLSKCAASLCLTVTNSRKKSLKYLVKCQRIINFIPAAFTESHADSSYLHISHYISIAGGTSREVQYLPQSFTVKPSGFSILLTPDFITSKYCGL